MNEIKSKYFLYGNTTNNTQLINVVYKIFMTTVFLHTLRKIIKF